MCWTVFLCLLVTTTGFRVRDVIAEKTGVATRPARNANFTAWNSTGSGQPIEFFPTPGSWSDTRALKMYQFDLPDDALVTGDKAYNDYGLEDMMLEANINLLPLWKKNSHRTLPPWMTYLLSYCRKVVETTGSLIERLLPKHIHAVTVRGFELKIALFVLAASFNSF